MKLVYLHQYFVTPDQSGGIRSYSLAKRLVEKGHEVHMITSETHGQRSGGSPEDGWRVNDVAGITVHSIPVSYDNSMSYVSRMIAFAKFAIASCRRAASIECNVVFATSTPLTIAIPGIFAAWRQRVPMVFEVRDLWPDVPIALGALRNPVLRWLARRLERLAYTKARHVVALAPGMREAVLATGCKSPDEVSVIPNGADLEVFSAASQGQESLRSEHGLGGKKLLVYAGAFGVANGTAYLVELAYACLKVDSTVVIVGLGDGKERPEVLDYAREKGVLDNNLLLPGSVAKHEAARWVQSADLALALFTGPRVLWKDATQNKFFDALAAGVPMACNFRGWQCEIAEENSVGFVLDADDPDAAARLVSTKLSDASWVAGARKRSRELASTEYSMDKHATRLEAILDKAAQA